MNTLPRKAGEGDLSVREKAVEVAEGVYVTKMGVRALNLVGKKRNHDEAPIDENVSQEVANG